MHGSGMKPTVGNNIGRIGISLRFESGWAAKQGMEA